MRLILTISIFFISTTAYPAQILFDGFEDGTDDNWECDYVQGNTSVVTSTPSPYAGTYSFKQPSSNEGIIAYFFADHPDSGACDGGGSMVSGVRLTWYQYFDSGGWATVDTKMFIFNSFDAWGACTEAENQDKPNTYAAYYFTISVNGSGQPYGQLVRADGLQTNGECRTDVTDGALWTNYTQNQGGAVALNQGQWEKVKVRLVLNSLGNSDGIFQLWINDVLKADYSNINYRGNYSDYGWNHLSITSLENPSSVINYTAKDNILLESDSTPILTIKGAKIIGGKVQ